MFYVVLLDINNRKEITVMCDLFLPNYYNDSMFLRYQELEGSVPKSRYKFLSVLAKNNQRPEFYPTEI